MEVKGSEWKKQGGEYILFYEKEKRKLFFSDDDVMLKQQNEMEEEKEEAVVITNDLKVVFLHMLKSVCQLINTTISSKTYEKESVNEIAKRLVVGEIINEDIKEFYQHCNCDSDTDFLENIIRYLELDEPNNGKFDIQIYYYNTAIKSKRIREKEGYEIKGVITVKKNQLEEDQFYFYEWKIDDCKRNDEMVCMVIYESIEINDIGKLSVRFLNCRN